MIDSGEYGIFSMHLATLAALALALHCTGPELYWPPRLAVWLASCGVPEYHKCFKVLRTVHLAFNRKSTR